MDVNKIYIITLIVLGSIAGLLLIIGCFLPVYTYYELPDTSNCDNNNTTFIQNLKIGNNISVPGQYGCGNDGDGSSDIKGGNIYEDSKYSTTNTTICSNINKYDMIFDTYTNKICGNDLAVIDVKTENMTDTNPSSTGYGFWKNNNEKCLYPSSTPSSIWSYVQSNSDNDLIDGQLCYKFDGNNCNIGCGEPNSNATGGCDKYTTKSSECPSCCDRIGLCVEMDSVSSIKNGGSYIKNGEIFVADDNNNICGNGYTKSPSLTKNCQGTSNKYLCYKKTKYN